MSRLNCENCASEFVGKTSHQRFCSDKCRYAAEDRKRGVPCASCGEQMKWQSKLVPGISMHKSCREKLHNPATSYRKGCRCGTCLAYKAESMRVYMAAYKEKHGVAQSTTSRRAFREAKGYWPNRRGSDWIEPKLRLEIYERDGWECHLCSSPVDRDAHWNDNYAPSLDHITPKSLGGSHEPDNLKTAHRVCNSRKGAPLEFA